MTLILNIVLIILSVLISTSIGQTWSGNVCSRLICTSERVRVCSYRTWRACCAYKWVSKTKYRTEQFCCSGWRDTNGNRVCNQAICYPPCENGGTCSRPNKCDCLRGNDGPTCAGVTCSHIKPCYPGVCSNQKTCQCQEGFTGNTCQIRQSKASQLSNIWLCRATLSNVERVSNMEKYNFVTDASDPSDPSPDEIWSNQLTYNYLMVQASAQFNPDVPAPPEYIKGAEFGVVRSSITVTLTKIPRPGEPVEPITQVYPCPEISATSRSYSFWNCTVVEEDFVYQMESGDNLTVTSNFFSGGYRDLVDLNSGRLYKTENYTTLSSSKRLLFKFDKIKPTHCNKNCRNGETPLNVGRDVTQNAISLTWSGYEDSLSGMYRYAWEIFKLDIVDTSHRLREKEPLNPMKIEEVFHNNLTFPIIYKPPVPGMYSVILEASDRANNSIYVRQLVLYDNQSSIEQKTAISFPTKTSPPKTLDVWQSNLDADITIDWSGHFVNALHYDNGYLNEVLKYPVQFAGEDPVVGSIDNFKQKFIRFDDETGQRSTKSVPNIRGIIDFTIQWKLNGKRLKEERKLQDNKTMKGVLRKDGDTLEVSIIASDIMGHKSTDTAKLHFDSTDPNLDDITKNSGTVTDMSYTYGTRMTFKATDEDSGIHEIRYRLERRNTVDEPLEVVESGEVQGQLVQRCEAGDDTCYCVKMGKCYKVEYTLDVDHCWFNVSKNYLDTAIIDLKMDAVNSAGLITAKSTQFSNIRSLSGIGYYSAPDNLRVVKSSYNSVQIGWNKSESCYYLTEFWLKRSDRGQKEKVHRLNRFEEIGFLQPETNYTVELIAGYDGYMSDPVIIVFITEKKPEEAGLTAGAKAGIGIGIILLIIIIVLIAGFIYTGGALFSVIMGRTKTYKKEDDKEGQPKRTLFSGDEDIYIYGVGSGGGVNLPLAHIVPKCDIALQELIAQGKFAKVYKASMTGKNDQQSIIAAKLLLDNFTEDEQRLMCAKITFMSDVIGEHPNVLQFIGAVVDNDIWGPTMLIEYCEIGQLITWLHEHKKSVNDDIIERLFQFSYGIVKGMAYLSSINVIHRRLAARNVLLTFVLEPKITGFGPSVVDTTDDQKAERVPVRWVAPECFQSTKAATEKSDVWSFGIILYEIFTLGDQPYPTLTTENVVPKVRHGHRMKQPELADEFNYNLMTRCWSEDQHDRPKFVELQNMYQRFMNGEPNDNDYSNYSRYTD
ncbi:uncharacterized protein LOC126831943 [Patella vulgata]|uniref:uncharacterized protein LOC126831943 n=1 Tax=Patella vulgata TaxID=6465 RepID=UPI0024A8B2FD|nr:uncharacterized protein LOC126831943 [Patella vulgata]